MSSLKFAAACAAGVLALSSTAAHAIVIPTTVTASIDVGLNIEIEGGTLAALMTPDFEGSETTTGTGPNSTMLNGTLTQVSSIDIGCISPTFGCNANYSLSASASASDGSANAGGSFGVNRFEIVVENSATLTVTLTTYDEADIVSFGNGDNPGAVFDLFFGGMSLSDRISVGVGVLPSSRGDLFSGRVSTLEILSPGTYELLIGSVLVRANAGQDAPIMSVDAPQSLAVLGFGLLALGAIRKRRA